MNLTCIIEALISAGATPQMLLAAVKAHESELETKANARRETDAARQRRHRMSRGVTVTNSDSRDTPPFDGPLPCPPHPLNPTPLNTPHNINTNARAKFDFIAWYALYPHKVGRGAAEKSYAKASCKASAEEMLEGLRNYIRTKPPDREYCNPATWLNQERWKDEPAEIKQNGTHFKSNDQPAKPTKDDRARAAVMRAAERLGFANPPQPGGATEAGP